MSGISSGDYFRVAQLDGALAFNMVLSETRELVSNSAMAGLRGLRESMGTGTEIAELSRQLEQVKSSFDAAVRAEENNRFSPAGQGVTLAVANAVDTSLKSQTGGVVNSANEAVDLANDADNGGSAAARAKEAAALNKQAADDLAAGDSQAGRSGATSAVLEAGLAVAAAQAELAAATELRDEARDRLGDLNADLEVAGNAVPQNPGLIASLTEDRDAAVVTLNAAEQAVTSAQSVLAAAQAVEGSAQNTLALANAPIALIDSENPTVFDLDNGYAVAIWGDSGFWTLTDANGEGIIVSPDGQVDPLDGSGEGWQFSNTSTFVLPDGAKITVTPGSSAFLQVTRGNALLEFGDLAPGANPSVNGPRKGGRAADGQQNDGHIFTTPGASSQWKSGSSLLGAAGTREQVATDPIENELRIDSLDVEIPEGVVAYLGRIGFDLGAYDHDGDGKLNAQELALVVEFLAAAAESISDVHRKVLAGTAEGVAALFELNLFLEGLMRDVDESQRERRNLSAEEAAVADSIIERLNAAFAGLGTIQPPSFPPLPVPPGNRAASGPSERAATAVGAPGPGSAEAASRLVSVLEESGVGPVTEPDLLAEKIAALLSGLAKGGLGAGESGNLIGALAVLLSRAFVEGGPGNGVGRGVAGQIASLLEARLGSGLPTGAVEELAAQIAGLLSQAAVDGGLSPAGVSGTLPPLPSPSGNRAAVLPPELATIIEEASGLGPAEVASRLVSALEQSKGGPVTDPDLLAEKITALLAGLAKGGPGADESGNVIGELAALLSRASLDDRVGGGLAGQIAALLEARLGGSLPPGAVGELAGQLAGLLSQAAVNDGLSPAGVAGTLPSPPSPSGNRAAVLPPGLATAIEGASGLGAAEVASRLVAALEQSGVGPVTEPDLLAEKIAALLAGLAKGGLGADESGNLIGALAVLLSRASPDDRVGGGLAAQLAGLLSPASVDGALSPAGVSGTLPPPSSPSGNRAAVLPPELATIIEEASGLGPAEVASRLVSALGQSGVRPVTETDLLAEQIAARLTGLAKGGLEAGESGNLIGELAVLLSRAAGSGELGNAVRGAMTGQIAGLLESRLGGALSPGTVGELAGRISGLLALAALDGDISMASLSGKIAGLLDSVAGEAGLTGDAVAATSREAAAFLPRILAAGALPNGGLIAFIPALVTAISEGKGAAGAGEAAQNSDADVSGNALRRAGRLISGFSLNPRAEFLAQAFKEQPSEAAGVSGAAGAPPAAIGGPGPSSFASPGDIFFGSSGILEIIENLQTDEELLERVRRNLDAATRSQGELLGQAENVFVMARETVEKFFSLVSDSQLLQEVVFADDLSEVDKEMFIGKMNDLYRSWGIEWGGSEDGGPRTPEVEAQLVNKAVSSGMMI